MKLGDFRSQRLMRPDEYSRVTRQMVSLYFPTTTRTCSVRIGSATTGSMPTTVSLTTGGIVTMGSPFRSRHSLFSPRYLVGEFSLTNFIN